MYTDNDNETFTSANVYNSDYKYALYTLVYIND